MALDGHGRCLLEIESAADSHSAARVAGLLGTRVGLPADRVASLQLAASEAADNLYRHAENGVLLLQPVALGDGAQLIALDTGPGMDVEACLNDGYSTASTAGLGLGSLKRLADRIYFDSSPAGTAIVANFQRKLEPRFDVGAAGLYCPGETVSGDNWMCLLAAGGLYLAVVDGVGHGPQAAKAANLAIETLSNCLRNTNQGSPASLEEAISVTHTALLRSRGAAVSLLYMPTRGPASFAGVGNVAGMVVDDEGRCRGMTTLPGTAGLAIRTVRTFEIDLPPDCTVVLHTDGVQSRWRGDAPRRLVNGSPTIVALRLLRDFRRANDDATAVVVRRGRS